MRARQSQQLIVSPGGLLAAGMCYFAALLLAREKLQLLLLAALALAGIALLRQPFARILRRLSAMWVMLVLAGIIHFGFRWWLAPSGSLTVEGLRWLDESLFFTARLALFLVSGIALGTVYSIGIYVTVISSGLGRLTGSRSEGQTAALLRCAWTIVPSVREYLKLRSLAREARRVLKPRGVLSRVRMLRAEFFATIAYALRHADSLALGMWTREIGDTKVGPRVGRSQVASAVVCGVFCFLCLSILPL